MEHHFSDRFIYRDIGLWEWNIQTGELLINPRWAQIVGYRFEELVPISIATWEALVHPEDLLRSEYLIQEHIRGESPLYACEMRMRHKDGHWIWVSDRGQIISYTSTGMPEWMSGYQQEITQRKEAYEALHAHQSLLRTIVDELPDVFVLKDHEGNFLMCNQSVANLYHSTPEAMVGKNDGDFGVPAELAEFMRSNVLEIMERGETEVVYEDSRDATTGAIRHFRSIKKPFKNAQGLNRIIVIAQDITDLIETNQKVVENERRLNEVLEATDEGIWDWSLSTGSVVHNSRWYTILGYEKGEIEDTVEAFGRLIHPADQHHVQYQLQRLLSGEDTTYYSEHRMIRKGGEAIWVKDRGKVTRRDAQGNPLQVVGSFADISSRKRYEENLRLLASVFTHAHEGIMITDVMGVIIDVNEAFETITGYARDEAIGQTPKIFQSGHTPWEVYQDMKLRLEHERFWSGEITNKTKGGMMYTERLTISAVVLPEVVYYVAIFADITEQKRHEDQLEYLAHFDPLTGLPNRLLLSQRLQEAMHKADREGIGIIVAYIDLDGFKAINDQYGHAIGDRVLKMIAERMHSCLRENDTLARLGGDEFVAVMERWEDDDAHMRRMLAMSSQQIVIDTIHFELSASIGMSLYPQNIAIDADQLLRQADQAMYTAKLSGKSGYHLFDTLNDHHLREHHQSIKEIRHALEQGELVLYYQPKVHLQTRRVIGYEALLRWHHPTKGIILPMQFLPEIENHPLGIDIGEWVLHEALRQLMLWRETPWYLPISINITAHHLQQGNFVERLEMILHAYSPIQPHFIELEILESSAILEIERINHIIRQCQSLGVRFSLDDFGTGFSSLSYLKRLPIDTIKIDQSFVRNMLHDEDNAKIIEAIMGLARAFDRDVVAEGVETLEHIAPLRHLGCQYAQGYAFARPMEGAVLLDRLNHSGGIL